MDTNNIILKDIPEKYRNMTLSEILSKAEEGEQLKKEPPKDPYPIDGLTGLPNKDAYNIMFRAILNNPESYPFSLVMGDMDHFKEINDLYGHHNGDEALKNFAQLLQSCLRTGTQEDHSDFEERKADDYVFRWGGEEFAMILSKNTPEQTQIVLERIKDELTRTELIPEFPHIRKTCSFGVINIEKYDPNMTPDKLADMMEKIAKSADAMLYHSKENGRNRISTTFEFVEKKKDTRPLTYIQKEFIVFYTGLDNKTFAKKMENIQVVEHPKDLIFSANSHILEGKSRVYHFNFGVGIYVTSTMPMVTNMIDLIFQRRKDNIITKSKINTQKHHIYRIVHKLTGHRNKDLSNFVNNHVIEYTQYGRLSDEKISQYNSLLSTPSLLGVENYNILDIEDEIEQKELHDKIASKIASVDFINYEQANLTKGKINTQEITIGDFVTIHDPALDRLKDTYFLYGCYLKPIALKLYLNVLDKYDNLDTKDLWAIIKTRPDVSEPLNKLYDIMLEKYDIINLYHQLKKSRETQNK